MTNTKTIGYAFLGGFFGTCLMLFLSGTFFTNLSTALVNFFKRAFCDSCSEVP